MHIHMYMYTHTHSIIHPQRRIKYVICKKMNKTGDHAIQSNPDLDKYNISSHRPNLDLSYVHRCGLVTVLLL